MIKALALIILLSIPCFAQQSILGECYKIKVQNKDGTNTTFMMKVIMETQDEYLMFMYHDSSTLKLSKAQVLLSIIEFKLVGTSCPE